MGKRRVLRNDITQTKIAPTTTVLGFIHGDIVKIGIVASSTATLVAGIFATSADTDNNVKPEYLWGSTTFVTATTTGLIVYATSNTNNLARPSVHGNISVRYSGNAAKSGTYPSHTLTIIMHYDEI